MQYLVTGSAGFVGTAVVEALLRTGATVHAVDLIDYPAHVETYLRGLGGTLFAHRGDARDPDVLGAVLLRDDPLTILHCAAHTPNPEGERRAPRHALIANVDATMAVLDYALAHRLARFIYVSSGGVYGDLRDRTDLRDDLVAEDMTEPRPRSLYAVAKHTGELAVLRYRSLWNLPIHVARVGLTYGPWERLTGARELVSAPHQMVSLARRGEPLVIERESWRGWTSSRDMATGLVGLAQAAWLDHDIYNIATPHRWPLSRFAERLRARLPGTRFTFAEPGATPNVWLRFDFDSPNFDISRLEAAIGSDKLMGVDASIEDYLDWVERFWSPEFMPI